jgi:hypothetical protein
MKLMLFSGAVVVGPNNRTSQEEGLAPALRIPETVNERLMQKLPPAELKVDKRYEPAGFAIEVRKRPLEPKSSEFQERIHSEVRAPPYLCRHRLPC